MIKHLEPIYAARFTADELNQLIAFYRTPIGHRLADEQATIGIESMRAGQIWGAEVGAQVAKDLAAQGVPLQ